MKNFKSLLRQGLLLAFLLLAAAGIGFGPGVPLPPMRKEDRIEVIAEKTEEEEEKKEEEEHKF